MARIVGSRRMSPMEDEKAAKPHQDTRTERHAQRLVRKPHVLHIECYLFLGHTRGTKQLNSLFSIS